MIPPLVFNELDAKASCQKRLQNVKSISFNLTEGTHNVLNTVCTLQMFLEGLKLSTIMHQCTKARVTANPPLKLKKTKIVSNTLFRIIDMVWSRPILELLVIWFSLWSIIMWIDRLGSRPRKCSEIFVSPIGHLNFFSLMKSQQYGPIHDDLRIQCSFVWGVV